MSQSLQIGTVLGDGRYVIEKVLGVGGFGITYYARRTELGFCCAVKELFINGKCMRSIDKTTVEPQGLDDLLYERLRNNFVEEARVLAKLDNPHVVKVLDVFDENNTSYMVMEFVPGITLQNLVEQNGEMPYDDSVNVMGQLSEAVAYIHQKHILHRDIKPENIIITPDNRIVLIDFGSAREFVHDQTQRHTAILTKGYAPIEQYTTESRKGNYTDIYAMGGVFYYLLTGTAPKDATLRAIEPGVMSSPKELNSNIPDKVSCTIMKAMELKPEGRYQSVEDFMEDLLGGDTKEIPLEKEGKQEVKRSKNKAVIFGVLGTVVAIVVVIVLVLMPKSKEELADDYVMDTNDTIAYTVATIVDDVEQNEKDSIFNDTIVTTPQIDLQRVVKERRTKEPPTSNEKIIDPPKKGDDNVSIWLETAKKELEEAQKGALGPLNNNEELWELEKKQAEERLRKIKKELEEYEQRCSDSAKQQAPKFGLG